MKFNCGLTPEERHERSREKARLARRSRDKFKRWHRWFAWYPVRVGSGDCRWLEFVERKGEHWYDDAMDAYYEGVETWKAARKRGEYLPVPYPPFIMGPFIFSNWSWEYRALQTVLKLGA